MLSKEPSFTLKALTVSDYTKIHALIRVRVEETYHYLLLTNGEYAPDVIVIDDKFERKQEVKDLGLRQVSPKEFNGQLFAIDDKQNLIVYYQHPKQNLELKYFLQHLENKRMKPPLSFLLLIPTTAE